MSTSVIVREFVYDGLTILAVRLAYFVIRSVLTRLIWAFDMELQDESRDWDQDQNFILVGWDSLPLRVVMSHRKNRGG